MFEKIHIYSTKNMKFEMQSKSMLPSYITATRRLVFFLKNNKKVFRYQFKIKKNTNMLIWTFQKLPLWNLLKISTTWNITTTLDHCIAKSNPKEKKFKFWLMNLNLLSYRSRWSDLFITIEVENWSPMILAIERYRSLDSHDPCYPR